MCTGNTCRSPMAEAIFRELASQHFQCAPERLWDHDLDVLSAGVAAGDSHPASSQSVTVLKKRGIDLSHHLSQQVSEKMLEGSDLIFAMTSDHLNVLHNARPDLAGKMRLLSNDGRDVIDPIGGSLNDYEQCAEMISGCLKITLQDILTKDAEA